MTSCFGIMTDEMTEKQVTCYNLVKVCLILVMWKVLIIQSLTLVMDEGAAWLSGLGRRT